MKQKLSHAVSDLMRKHKPYNRGKCMCGKEADYWSHLKGIIVSRISIIERGGEWLK